MAQRSFELHIVPHTRWHREGYETFQLSRLKLVRLLDHLLDALSEDDLSTSFLADGQVILIADYLEVRPEQLKTITELTKPGRLHLGPWYALPDPFLVSPEALIRNLQHGSHLANQLGKRLDAGYMPQTSGQIGQMPQILRGFGIENAVVQHGLGNAPAELWWEAPDGSQVFTVHLRDGYDNAASLPEEPSALKSALAEARDKLREYTYSDAMLLMYGSDQTEPDIHRLATLDEINKGFQGTKITLTSLPDYIQKAREQSDSCPVVKGELRSPERFPLSPGVLSSRAWIHRRNQQVQSLIERWAEPSSVWALLLGRDKVIPFTTDSMPPTPLRSQADLLWYAWQVLLPNHAVDTVQGTFIDQVEHEVRPRFDQAEQIAEGIVTQNLSFIASLVDTAWATEKDGISVVVFNPSSTPRSDLVEVPLSFDEGAAEYVVVDPEGQTYPVEVESPEGSDPDLDFGPAEPLARFVARDVPPLGYRTYVLRRTGEGDEDRWDLDYGDTIENERFTVKADSDEGTLLVFDKQTGRSFAGLNRYVDGGDAGDAYTYRPPKHDTEIAFASNAPFEIMRSRGPVTETLHMLQIYRLPLSLNPERDRRLPLAMQFAPTPIITTVRLAHGVERIDIMVELNNNAEDHRLRVHFPTGIVTQEALFDGHYEIVEQAIALPDATDTTSWAEQPTAERPQRAFVTVQGDDTGLTIANRGLPEAAVLAHTEHGTEIALTLLRSVGLLAERMAENAANANATPIETPKAQAPGDHTLRYSLIPHGENPLPAWQQAWHFQTDLRAVRAVSHPGPLPNSASLVNVDNDQFVVNSVKTAAEGDDLIIRGFNLSDEPQTVSLKLVAPLSEIYRARLDETVEDKPLIPTDNGTYKFEVGPHQVVTLRASL
jgi:mannosylglycerate hydrolase